MYHVIDTAKPFAQAADDLEKAVAANGFGVLHIHDLGKTLRSKGIDFAEDCRVFEVCNPVQASRVLATDMRLNMALPCRISVYTEGGQTKIGMIQPGDMLASLSEDPDLRAIAAEVETVTTKIIAEAA